MSCSDVLLELLVSGETVPSRLRDVEGTLLLLTGVVTSTSSDNFWDGEPVWRRSTRPRTLSLSFLLSRLFKSSG